MLKFVIRRLLEGIPVIIVASFLVFGLAVNAGTPAPIENLLTKPNHDPAQVAALEHQYGIDKPFLNRYVSWAGKAIHGDFGKNNSRQSVWDNVWHALLVTLRLVLFAEIIAVLLGVTVGVISAVRQYSWFDHATTGVSFLFFAMPVFWFAVLLKLYGAVRLNNVLHSWFGADRLIKTIGDRTPNFHGGFFARWLDYSGYTILPAMTLILISYAQYSRYQRSSMLETLGADYVRTARAKGVPERSVILRHAFRNALIPVTTVVSLDFGALLGGAIITEFIFGWRGMGTLFYNSVTQVDPNTLLCWLIVVATTVVLFNILADVLYAYLDPRIRLD